MGSQDVSSGKTRELMEEIMRIRRPINPLTGLALSIAFAGTLFTLNTTRAASLPERNPAEKEWTMLVFLNGHNNLDSFGAQDINEMERVGSTDKINVVVQWASLGNNDTRRLLVQKDTDASRVTSPVIQSLPRVDMGRWENLVEFVEWGVRNYPAKRYFIDVWDHGSGWHKMQGNLTTRDISWDDITHSFMTTEQLGQAMRVISERMGRKIDLYGSDACLMAMAEVAGEMKGSVDTFVGSEEVEPGAGWAYDGFLAAWSRLPEMTPTAVARALVETYVDSYSGGSQGSQEVTLSAFNLSKTEGLERAVTELGTKLRRLAMVDRKKVVNAARTALSFTYSDYVDLGDFLQKVEMSRIEGMDARGLADLRAAISEYVVALKSTRGYSDAHGVAIWAPSSKYTYRSHAQRYRGLDFHRATQWGDALEWILQDAQ
jgi:hypothetical protein